MGGRTPLTKGIKELVGVKISIVAEEETSLTMITLKQVFLGGCVASVFRASQNLSILNLLLQIVKVIDLFTVK